MKKTSCCMSPSHPIGRLPRSFPICLGGQLHGSVSRTCITGLLIGLTASASFAQSNTPDASNWVTNGTVWDMLANGSTMYLEGDFTHFSPIISIPHVMDHSNHYLSDLLSAE